MDGRDEAARATVSWDLPSRAVLIRFKGYFEGEALRVPCDKVIELLISKRSDRLITDSREMKALTQDDQRWIDDEWRARARSAGLRNNAILLPQSSVARLSVSAIVRKLDGIQFAYFSELDEARKWLKSL